MSTLIVRDATLAVNGAPETRGSASAHLSERLVEVRAMDPTTACECMEVLLPVAGVGDDTDPEVLLALTLLALAWPEQAQQRGASAVAHGRRLAARLEHAGSGESALGLIERLREEFPTHDGLERDHDAILGRLGMVQDLADRYLQRAQRLIGEGQAEEAAGWLREVLLLDGSRTDAARLLRDLRLVEEHGRPRRKLNLPLVAAALAPLVLVGLVLRERHLLSEFRSLPAATAGDLSSSRERLDALEEFFGDHPVWHGALGALSERSALRVEVARLEDLERTRSGNDHARLLERSENAELVRARALMKIDAGDFGGALEDLREALRLAPEDWPQRERVERDVAAVADYISEEHE